MKYNSIKSLMGERIRTLRLQKGISQTQLGLLADMKLIGISQIECGKKFISEKTLIKLCNVLECKAKDIFDF